MVKTFAIGHKNPDTDSISAALAIAELKGMLGEEVIPARLGTLNEETKFATKYFDIEAPMFVSDARTILKDIDMDFPVQIIGESSVNDAFVVVTRTHNKTLYVTDSEGKLEGIVSLGDLAGLRLKERIDLDLLLKKSDLFTIAKDTKSDILVEKDFQFDGTVKILSSSDDHLQPHSIILCRSKNLKNAIKKDPTLIIYTEEDKEDTQQWLQQAEQMNISVLKSRLSLEEIVLVIYYAIPVKLIMSTNWVSFNESEYVDDVKDEIMKTRFRSYPVMNDQGCVTGCISRYHLFNYRKNQYILVDHSSRAQSINHIEDSDIIEVVDHHHIGDIQTKTPINYQNRKCGSTCSIIYSMYVENGLLPTKKVAGMMLSAIISDTIHFKSKTTVHSDMVIAKALARICGVDVDQYATLLLNASVNLKDADITEIISRDLKEYHFAKYHIAVAQTNYSNIKDIQPRLNEFKDTIANFQKEKEFDLFIMMFTNVSGDGTLFIFSGPKSNIMNQIIENEFDHCSGFDSKIMSRKQQLIPLIGKMLEQ